MPSSEPHRGDLLPGGSEMARRMRGLDWSATDLGPPEAWPDNLRVASNLCLTSRFPILIWWGPSLSVLYNDAYIPFLGPAKHPRALGRPGRECWAEIWNAIGPMLDRVLATGTATWQENYLFYFDRRLAQEEVYVTFTYSPILGSDGQAVEGVFCPCYETTAQVVGERRLETLRRLGLWTGKPRSVAAVCDDTIAVLRENPRDVSFAGIYLVDQHGTHAHLHGTTVPGNGSILPARIRLDGSRTFERRFNAVLRERKGRLVSLRALGIHLDGTEWPEPVREAVSLPIPAAARDRPAGLLVLGVGQRRVLDPDYRTFLELVAGQLGTALNQAEAYESERRRAEALVEIDRAKTAFFSNVSHEFRTPLTLMLGPLEDSLADEEHALSGTQRQRLEVAHRNSLRLLKLVNGLLDFSRIEAGRLQASCEPVDLGSLTVDLASNFRAACQRAGIELKILCHADPPSEKAVYVDRDMWEKIVLNLLSNAFKFTFEGSITVSLRFANGTARLSVADTGTGIPPSARPHLFERFYQVPGARGRTSEGSGIGLSLVNELVKLHGGTVEVASVPGRGSKFTISIPVGGAHLPQERITAERTQTPTASGARGYVEEALRWLPGAPAGPDALMASPASEVVESPDPAGRQDRPRILWADDNADMREYVERLLGSRYQVQAVPSGEAALTAAQAAPPDLVLSDVMMPGMDGFALLRRLRSDPRTREVPIILVSARAGEESRIEGLGAGADDYLVKPFSARELMARVGGALKLARVRREALIEEAELRAELVDILESLTDGFMALDEEWRIRYVNAAAEQTNAMARESLLGRTFWEAFPAVLGTEIEQNLRRAMGERVQVSGEAYSEPDGRWYEMDIHPTRGRHLAFFGRDITERKRAEEIQRRLQRERDEALARLHRKFERMPIACILFDAQYRITDWNPAAEAIFGYRREEVVGKNGPEILVTPRVLEESQDILRRLSAGDMDAHSVNENVTKDGRTIVCEWHNTPVQDADGKVISFVSMAQDITQRVKAEAALRESEERYRSLISQVSEYAIFSTDGVGMVRSWNEGCQQVLGYSEAEFIGLDVAELFSPEDRAAALPADQLREARGLGALRSYRWMQARDGRRFYSMGVTTALTDATGEPNGFSMILRDVTQMKLLQDELMSGEEELSQLVTQRTDELQWTTDRLRLSERMASLGTLSAGLGHDLGNILLPMEIRLRLLLDSDLTPELRELVSGIGKGTQYLQGLAGGLRSLSLDPDAGPETGTTELRAWLHEVDIILRNVLGRHISFEYGTPPAECWVGIKSVSLTQVVYNLVQNATDALRGREGGRVRLGIRDDPEVDVVLLRVSDNGPGMSPEVIRRCMEPYFSTKPRGVSTGMGLTFVHRLVTGAGGRMDIDSTVGQGTTISLTLLRAKPAEGVELPAEADRAGSAGGSLTPPRQR